MTRTISPDTQAILLLCGRFGERQEAAGPLTPGEYGRLVSWLRERELRPSDLLDRGASSDLTSAKLDPARIDALLKRGAALALATEKWLRSGLWIISRGDETYPGRLKKKLGLDAPALLYGAGDPQLLDLGGLAIVGSRNVSEELLEFTRRVSRRCAVEGMGVVSGGARGIDSAAMQGASEAGGKVVGVLADSLLRATVNRENRQGLEDGRLVLVSSFNPEAGFNAGNAMQRNSYIYALSDAALVVQSDLGKGGTWTGAVENLEHGWVPLFVREDSASPGNVALLKDGARPFLPDGSIRDLPGAVPQPAPASAELFKASVASEPPASYEVAESVAFLGGLPKRRVTFDKPVPFTPIGLYLGNGALGLEVVVVESGRKPVATELRNAWRLRQGGRAVPVLVVALGPDSVAICGPSGEEPPVAENVDTGQAERLCREALTLPDRHAALRFLSQALPSLETKLPGIRNQNPPEAPTE